MSSEFPRLGGRLFCSCTGTLCDGRLRYRQVCLGCVAIRSCFDVIEVLNSRLPTSKRNHPRVSAVFERTGSVSDSKSHPSPSERHPVPHSSPSSHSSGTQRHSPQPQFPIQHKMVRTKFPIFAPDCHSKQQPAVGVSG